MFCLNLLALLQSGATVSRGEPVLGTASRAHSSAADRHDVARRDRSEIAGGRGCTTIYDRIRPDSGDCVVSAAATAVTTWRVQNGSAAAGFDLCAVALELARLTVNLGP